MSGKTRLRRWGIAVAVSLLITAGVLAARDYRSLFDYADKMSALCDAFFVPGILFAGVAAISFIADDGLFDIFSYGFSRFLSVFRFRKKEEDDDLPKTFYDYRVMKHEGKKSSLKFLFVIAGANLLASVLLLLLSGNY